MTNEFESLNKNNKVDNYYEGIDDSQYVDYKNNLEAVKKAQQHNQQNLNQSRISGLNNSNNPQNNKNLGATALKNRVNSNNNKNSSNSRMTNELASKGLQAAQIPKPIADAVVNSKVGQKAIETVKKKNPALNILDKLMGGGKNTDDDQQPSDGPINFEISEKTKKIALAIFPFASGAVVFCCLLVAATQTYLNVITIGNADASSSSEIDEKISRSTSEQKDEEITDERLEEAIEYNVTIKRKNYASSYVLTISNGWSEKKRKYNEANLAELEDFYGGSLSYNDETAYDFYYKLHDIYVRYSSLYNVELDLPLLMSTLMLESKDMSVIFESNTSDDNYDYTTITDSSIDHILDYHHDWASEQYIISSESSAHDIEILAQNMVSIDSNGKYVIDEDKYKEFLKEFLEKKYFIEEGGVYEGKSDNRVSSSTLSSCPSETPFTKYNLTEDQLIQIASLAYHEQGTAKGAAAEASLMANLFELKGSKYGTGADGLYNYVRNSGWFANSSKFMDSKDASSEIVEAVRSVLVYGKRTLPAYIDEHDYIGDITSVTVNGENISVDDKNSYVRYETELKNTYGSKYTFYSFPDTNSDPFGYTSEKIREEKGEFYYDFDTGEPQNCSSSTGTDLSSAFVSLAVSQLNDESSVGGAKYKTWYGLKSTDAWCAAFVSWNIWNTSYNGQNLSDIINKKAAAVDAFMNYFHDSNDSNIKFYYNDNCSTYSGMNGTSSTYTPKEGDLIFFDNNSKWNGSFPVSRSNLPNRHVGIVQYVKDGKVVTIEGNSGNRVKENSFSLSNCRIIGFGSWY